MELSRVRDGDLRIGQPVPWNLYDEGGTLLLARGMVLETHRQLEILLERGLFRQIPIGSRAAPPRNETPPVGETQLCGLEDVRMEVGDTLQLQADDVRYSVHLIGYLRGKSVITTTPAVSSHFAMLREGQAFVVRLFSGKHVFAFRSTLYKVMHAPFPHLHFTYPSQVEGKLVRQGIRAHVRLIASVLAATGANVSAQVTDLSASGASLMAREELGIPGERIQLKLRIRVGGVEEYLSLLALIRTTHPHEGQVRHGVQFVDVPHVEQVALTAYVYQSVVEGGVESTW